MIPIRIIVLTIFVAVLSASSAVFAADELTFKAKNSFSNPHTLKNLEIFTFSAFAQVDLNDDGIDELILRNSSSANFSEFHIIGLNNNKVFELGEVTAHKLMISYNRNHGVRSLLAFKNNNNDYDYTVYQWDAETSHYVDQGRVLREDKI